MEIDVIGVPLDLGANRRGVDMGPSAIRYAGLKKAIEKLNIIYNDLGNIDVPMPENSEGILKYVNEISKVNGHLARKVAASLSNGHIPLVLGGDHSIAAGTITGTQSVYKNIGVIWMDAHGDYNTEETTTSGNLHGMPLAAVTGAGALDMVLYKEPGTAYVNPGSVVLVGVRDLDNEEAKLLKRSGIHVFTMSDVDMYGIKNVMEKAVEIAENNTAGFHLSFDMDVINPNEAPGVGTPVYGGITYREAHLACEMIAQSKRLLSVEFVEVNPIQDHSNRTGEVAVSLICSVFGKRIF